MSAPPFLHLPDGVRARRLRSERGELAALDAAPRGATRGAALLVPGFTGSKEDFIAVLEPLAARGWRVLSLDLPGQFESPHAQHRSGYDVAELAADVLAVADVLSAEAPGGVHLVGHSFGGLVARAAVLQQAGAGGRASDGGPASGIASVTLLCSGPAMLPEPRAGQLRLLVNALGQLDLVTIWAIMTELDAENGVALPDPEIAAFLERRFLANDPVSLQRFAEQLLAEPDRIDELAAVTARTGVPVLVAHGAGDDAWTAASQKEMAARTGGRYEVLEAAAHSPAAERPEQTAALLSGFWADVACR